MIDASDQHLCSVGVWGGGVEKLEYIDSLNTPRTRPLLSNTTVQDHAHDPFVKRLHERLDSEARGVPHRERLTPLRVPYPIAAPRHRTDACAHLDGTEKRARQEIPHLTGAVHAARDDLGTVGLWVGRINLNSSS